MTFDLSKHEQAVFVEWNKRHLKDHHDGEESYGNGIAYEVRTTLIGTGVSAICLRCRSRGTHHDLFSQYLTDHSLRR